MIYWTKKVSFLDIISNVLCLFLLVCWGGEPSSTLCLLSGPIVFRLNHCVSSSDSFEPSLGKFRTSLLVKISKVLEFTCLLYVLVIVLLLLGNFLSSYLFILSRSQAIRNVRFPRLNFPYGKLQYWRRMIQVWGRDRSIFIVLLVVWLLTFLFLRAP